jgi:putative tryptophan/tyrosine transport system substrate-binding protein
MASAGAIPIRELIRCRHAIVVLLAVFTLFTAPPAVAQQDKKVFRIGAVSAGAGRDSPHWIAFDKRLSELGYVEGRNLTTEFRNAEGKPERLAGFMTELIRSGVDAIFAPGPEASLRAAKMAASSIPIIVVAIDYDPVAHGYVNSLARPGGNITGVFIRQLELTAKRVELLKQAVPRVRHMVVFWDAFSADQLKEADAAARSAGLGLHRVEFRNPPYSFDDPLKAAAQQHAEAMLGLASPVFFRQRAELGQAAIRNRLPAISPFPEAAEAGMLMAYGASLPDTHRRAAEYIDRIFKGASPADLPMEQPTKFELVINLKTAKSLGLTIPPSILARADRVVE